MISLVRFRVVRALLCLLMIITPACGLGGQTPQAGQDYVPPELQASDPAVKAYLDSADKAEKEGNFPDAFQQLQKALDLATRKGFLADKALLEARLGAAYFVEGKLEDAKQGSGSF